MSNFRATFSILLIPLVFLTSCAANVEERIKKIDIYDADKLTKPQIENQVQLRKNKISELRNNIFKLTNHNEKFQRQLKLENAYGRESLDLKRFVELDNQLIQKYQLEINKLDLEIRVLKNKTNDGAETGEYKF